MMEGEGTAVDEEGIFVGGGVFVTLTKKVVVEVDVGRGVKRLEEVDVEVTDASMLLVVAVSKFKECAEAVSITVIVIGPVRIKPEGSAGVRLT